MSSDNNLFGSEFFIGFGIGVLISISGSIIAVNSFKDIRQFFRRII
jgi:hypothetical protein